MNRILNLLSRLNNDQFVHLNVGELKTLLAWADIERTAATSLPPGLNDLNGPEPLPSLGISEWVRERIENCERIARTKEHEDKEKWLEDAWYYKQILERLGCS